VSEQGRVDVAEPVGVHLVPVECDLEAFLPRHLLLPAQREQSVGVDEVAQIVEHTVFDEGHLVSAGAVVAGELDELLGHLQVGLLVGAADVVDVADGALEKNDFESAGNIFNEQEVSGVGAGSVQGDALAAHQLVDELGDQLLGVLVGAVHVVAAGDDDGHTERSVIRLGQKLGTGLGGGVGVGRLKHLMNQQRKATTRH
jgi:hypothetical protein